MNPAEFQLVTRAHLLVWRRDLEQRALSGATIRRKLAALSSLYEYLCESNAVVSNPVKGVKRPKINSFEGATPAIGDHEARALLNAPDVTTQKALRDRAILSTLLYHGLRPMRRGVAHLKVNGKGSKIRYLPLHPATAEHIDAHLQGSIHRANSAGTLFRPMKKTSSKTVDASITPQAYQAS